MAVTAYWYTNGPKHLLSDTSWTTDPVRVALTTSAYVPDQDAHEFYSFVTNELPTANGYTTGGVLLGSRTVTVDTSTNQTRLSAANAVWTATQGNILTARRAVIYKATGSAGTSPLLGWVDFGADVSATGDTLTIVWDPTGVLRITASS